MDQRVVIQILAKVTGTPVEPSDASLKRCGGSARNLRLQVAGYCPVSSGIMGNKLSMAVEILPRA